MPIQDQMPRQDDDLLTRVAALEKQLGTVTGIAATAASIKQTLVSPLVGESSASNFASVSSYSTFASFNLTVPTNFTRALISVSGFTNLNTSNSGSDQNWTRVLINGTAGPESSSLILGPGGPCAAFHVASLTGLTGGQTIAIAVQGHIQTGSNVGLYQQWNCATITATGLFLS